MDILDLEQSNGDPLDLKTSFLDMISKSFAGSGLNN
jgi:hypothetical protein